MKNPVASIKTLVLLLTIAFAGHVLATQDPWFSGTANNSDFDLVNATTNHPAEGVEIANDALSIDLPTGAAFQIAPASEVADAGENKKTYVAVDDAVFTPTAYGDIDNTVVEGAQTALTVAYDENNATNYYAYITNSWVKLSGADPVARPVDVTIELNYSDANQTNATFKVDGLTLCDEFTNDTFPISGERRALDHVELAGYGAIHSVTTTVEAVANVTITPGDVTYGADFTNVTITAKLSGTGYDSAEYSLTWNGASVAAVATVSGDTLTITAPINPPAAGRAPVTYAINVNGAAGETQNTVVADENEWVNENANTTRQTAAGGNWSNEVAYANSVADISDNTFTATRETTGDKVIITFKNLTYAELCDREVETPEGTQGAFALAEESDVKSFYILAMENSKYTWKATTCAGVAANTNIAYTIVMTFDYVSNTYSVSVSDGTNTGDLCIGSSSAFPLCIAKTSVTDFVFKGSGKLEAIQGVDSIGYMAKDSAGNWYATIAAATGSSGKEFIVLRPTGPAPSGWSLVTKDGVTKLIKNVAKGLFFMAY